MQILRPALSSALALTLVTLPTNSALAMQPAEAEQPAEGAGDAAPAETADPAAAGETPAEGDPAAGETPAEGDPAAAGETPAEGDPAAAGEADPAAEGAEGEGEAEAEAEAEGEGEGEGEEAAPEPAAAPEGPIADDMPTEPKIGKWPAKGTGMLISGGTMLALGTAGLISSIVLTNCPEPANSVGCKNQHNRDFLLPIAASVMTIGVLLLVVGGANAVKYKRWKESSGPKQALAPTFNRNGAGLAYSLRF